MGNSNSPLSVDYTALNKSCEQIRNIHLHHNTIDPGHRPPMITTKIERQGVTDDSNFPWDSGRSSESQLRSARSLPNVHEDADRALFHGDLTSDSPRERCHTITQPIRIPAASLTVENVALQQQQQQQQKQPLENQVPFNDSPRRIELVKCDDIIIHFDSLQSPGPSSGATQSPRAVPVEGDHHLHLPSTNRLRIGSAPPDFMSDFLPRRGEKIRCRHFSAGFEEGGSPSVAHINLASNTAAAPECSPFQQPRRGQTLISFLESFSSGDSDLERENAHFSICQAVICALEQLKWTSQLKKSHKSQSQASTASLSSDLEDEEDLADLSRDYDPELMSVSDVAPSGTAEWARGTNSAEVCALSLLSRFRKLPKACDIHWEGFDEGCGSYSSNSGAWPRGSFCRGTNDWAPPRPQIIFTRKGVTNSRKKTLQEQNYRCRGCGIHVSLEYSSTFRLCGYTGQFYCTACHRNQMSIIPGRVLDDWDFKLYPVSVVAYRLLEEIWFSPLFHISTIDPLLFKRVPVLSRARSLRGSLRLARDHVVACRFYRREAPDIFQDMPDYFTTDLELWSMADLKAVKRGSLQDYIKLFILRCEDHVKQCELCLARGYLCEICHKGDILYPWQPRVIRCGSCGACTHDRCRGETEGCSRCSRIRHRK